MLCLSVSDSLFMWRIWHLWTFFQFKFFVKCLLLETDSHIACRLINKKYFYVHKDWFDGSKERFYLPYCLDIHENRKMNEIKSNDFKIVLDPIVLKKYFFESRFPSNFLEMDFFLRYQHFRTKILLYRRTVITLLNDDQISNNARFLYVVIFAHRIAQYIMQIIEIFDTF